MTWVEGTTKKEGSTTVETMTASSVFLEGFLKMDVTVERGGSGIVLVLTTTEVLITFDTSSSVEPMGSESEFKRDLDSDEALRSGVRDRPELSLGAAIEPKVVDPRVLNGSLSASPVVVSLRVVKWSVDDMIRILVINPTY